MRFSAWLRPRFFVAKKRENFQEGMQMLPKGLEEQEIRALAEIGKTVFGVKIQLPTEEQ